MKIHIAIGKDMLKNAATQSSAMEGHSDAETLLLSDAYKHFFGLLSQEKITLDLALLFQIHEYFLGPPHDVNPSLQAFETTLYIHAPKDRDTKKQIAAGLAVIHCELHAIHPFREGNGRTIRLFLDLIAACVGYNPIDWSRNTQENYVQACVDGMKKEYSRMEKIIYAGLTKQNGNANSGTIRR